MSSQEPASEAEFLRCLGLDLTFSLIVFKNMLGANLYRHKNRLLKLVLKTFRLDHTHCLLGFKNILGAN